MEENSLKSQAGVYTFKSPDQKSNLPPLGMCYISHILDVPQIKYTQILLINFLQFNLLTDNL